MSFNKTFGLGGMSLVLVGLLMLSGALMLLAYKPVPQEAYQSVLSLRRDYLFGSLIRNIHFFSANLVVVLMVYHMLRVVFTLGYIQERRSNWFIGICLLGLILFSCFTGYLLPWDQTAYWAVTICIHMLDYVPFGTSVTSLITDGDGVTAPNPAGLFYLPHHPDSCHSFGSALHTFLEDQKGWWCDFQSSPIF